MKAALIEALGQPPVTREMPEPVLQPGEVLIELAASPLNPADVTVSTGRFYTGPPPLPHVPGIEGVGWMTKPGGGRALVYAMGGGLGTLKNGTASERFVAAAEGLIELPPDTDPAMAGALGTSGLAGWLPLAWRAPLRPGDTVLVLGATGAAGRVAVQAAKQLGAGRVIAAGRRPDALAALRALADEVVSLDGEDLGGRLAKACAPGADVICDYLWGAPLAVSLQATRAGARVVHVGQSAGASSDLASAAVRGKQLTIIGYSNFAVPREVLVDGYRRLLEEARLGAIHLPVTRVPLSRAATAWEGLYSGGGKYVLQPD